MVAYLRLEDETSVCLISSGVVNVLAESLEMKIESVSVANYLLELPTYITSQAVLAT